MTMKLGNILALVGASSMTEDDRIEWMAAAMDGLKGIPADLLERGARHARATCDHPAKVLPAILGEVRESWENRRRDRSDLKWLLAVREAPTEEPKPEERCTPEQARAIREQAGILLPEEARERRRVQAGPPRNPTPEDLREIAAEVGIPVVPSDDLPPPAPIAGLSVREIFEQRDRRRSAR